MMNSKRLGLLLVILIVSCGVAFAEDNNTTTLKIDDSPADETLEITNESDVLADEVNATSSGIRNITFSDGYNGYCINLTKDHADNGSVFTPRDTSHAMNNKYNTSIGNFLKILFVDFYDYATGSSDDASEVIWDFSDRYYLDSSNPITQSILKLAEDGRTIPDHGETKKIDDNTEATFDFEVFDPLNDDLQNYFGYKITLKAIENDTSEDNDTNTTDNETDTNTTEGNETSVNETDTNTTDNVTDTNVTEGNETSVNETDTNSTEDNETDTGFDEDYETIINDNIGIEEDDTIDVAEDSGEGNATALGSNENSSIANGIANATGNPILLLLLVLAILGFGQIRKNE